MSYDTRMAANAYSAVGLETTVATASPHQLILMLFDGAIKAVRLAKGHLRDRQIARKGERIAHAIAILEELTASLNHDVGGELPSHLEALYAHMIGRLVEANLHNREDLLDEVARLLGELRDAWAAVAPTPAAAGPLEPPRPDCHPASYGKV